MTAPSSPPITADVPSPSSEPTPADGARPDVREDLRSYADLGGFTLTAQSHAWHAAVETIGTPEEARSAATVLAESRAALPAVREEAARLAEGTPLTAPGTVERTRSAVALLRSVRDTLAVLKPEVYDEEDLDTLTAATADRAWRREHAVELSWGRRFSLRLRARRLAVSPWTRPAALRSALASAAAERADWTELGAEGRPAAPGEELVDGAARAVEAAGAALHELSALLRPDHDLETVPFEELSELLDRLAAEEGDLFRLPRLRALRDRLEREGIGPLLDELSERRANGAEAVAAYDARHGEPERDAAEGAAESGDAAGAGTETAAEEPVNEEPPAVVEEPAAEEAVEAQREDKAEEAAGEPEAAGDGAAESATTENPAADDVAAEDVVADEVLAVEPAAETVTEPDAEPVTEEPVTEEPVAEEPATEAPQADAQQADAQQAETPRADAPQAEAPRTEEPAPAQESAADTASGGGAAEERAGEPEAPAAATIPKPRRARRPRKPSLTPGRPVTAYSADELVALVRWIDSDSVERTEEELLRAAMKELGFARLGPRIKEALGAAITEARS
ncbi:hypothetical protein GCM10027168_48720 [Streptomyces capparidis]